MPKINPLEANKPVVLDLFCGAGGMSQGFKLAGYEIGLGIDVDLLACQTHNHNFNGHTVCKDLQEIENPGEFIREQGIERVDIIIGGPPCQGFSRVGRGKMRKLRNDPDFINDPRNKIYKEFVRFVEELKPAYFVMENVPDMSFYLDEGEKLLDKILKSFNRLGYKAEMQVLLAADYGVPQMRRRLFIIGNRSGKPIIWPEQSHTPDNYVTVWDAISDLPVVDINHRKDEIPYLPRVTLTKYQSLMHEGANGLLFNHQTRWHNEQDIQAFGQMPEGGKYKDLPKQYKRYRDDIFKDKYRKLKRGEPSWTIEAHIGKDTYRHIYPSIPGEPEPPRTISVREAARLQSFPDSFRFLGPFTKQFYQVGNAVPPLLAKAIAEHIRPHLITIAQ